jgi:hypothetical protein
MTPLKKFAAVFVLSAASLAIAVPANAMSSSSLGGDDSPSILVGDLGGGRIGGVTPVLVGDLGGGL